MPRKINSETPQERVVYILLSPNGKKFFIGHSLKKSLRETYRKNLLGIRQSTSKLIAEVKPERPCLFILETFVGTSSEATNLIIVWTKIFLENNYECYNHPNLIEMTENLYIDTQALYEERKTINIKKITACANCAIPKFNRQICEKYQLSSISEEPLQESRQTKREKEIRMMVSKEEYEIISGYANRLKMQVTPYIRRVALNPQIIQNNYSEISAHTKEIAEVRNIINRLIFTIDATNNYLPKEIETIVDLMNGLFQSENKLLKTIRESQ